MRAYQLLLGMLWTTFRESGVQQALPTPRAVGRHLQGWVDDLGYRPPTDANFVF